MIERCSEDHLFCGECDPGGECVQCEKPLCWEHYREAHRERKGRCTPCAVPRLPDAGLGRDWRQVDEGIPAAVYRDLYPEWSRVKEG